MQMVIHQLVVDVATNTILHNAPDAAKYERHWEHMCRLVLSANNYPSPHTLKIWFGVEKQVELEALCSHI